MRREELIRQVTQAFAKSDLAPLLESLDDEIVWHSAAIDTGPFRFGGVHRGKVEVREALSQMAVALTFARFDAKEIVRSGDVTWGLFDTAFVPAGKTETIEYLTAGRFKMRDEKLIEVHFFFDTAFVAAHLAR